MLSLHFSCIYLLASSNIFAYVSGAESGRTKLEIQARTKRRRFGLWLTLTVLSQSASGAIAAPVADPIKPVLKPGLAPLEQPTTTPREPIFFTIATGSPVGTYFAVGEAIAAVISHPKGSERCSSEVKCGPEGMLAIAQTSDGSVKNINAINAGDVASGLAQANLVDSAYKGESPFETQEPMVNLRTIGFLYSENIHVIAANRAEISSLADLRDKRISIDRPGSGHRTAALRLLEAYGISERDLVVVEVRTLKAIDLIMANKLDAFFFVGGVPVPAIREVLGTGLQSLIPLQEEQIEMIRSSAPLFKEAKISANTYQNIDDITTMSVGALWLVSADVSFERVYGITRAFWHEDNRETLIAGHDQGQFISLETVLTDLPVPLHAGAEAYYREIGLIKDAPGEINGVQTEAAPSPEITTH